MDLGIYATVARRLHAKGLDFSDMFIIGEYKRLKREQGNVKISDITAGSPLSKTIVTRRIKQLVTVGIFAKEGSDTDLRVRRLGDGPRMSELDEMVQTSGDQT